VIVQRPAVQRPATQRPAIRPLTAPGVEHPSICPHCWNVNPGPFRLCARCGASMETFLQESGGLRRTAAVQSPVLVARRLSTLQRLVIGIFLLLLALAYLTPLLAQAFRRQAGQNRHAASSGAPHAHARVRGSPHQGQPAASTGQGRAQARHGSAAPGSV
jgi:hypothetical protein